MPLCLAVQCPISLWTKKEFRIVLKELNYQLKDIENLITKQWKVNTLRFIHERSPNSLRSCKKTLELCFHQNSYRGSITHPDTYTQKHSHTNIHYTHTHTLLSLFDVYIPSWLFWHEIMKMGVYTSPGLRSFMHARMHPPTQPHTHMHNTNWKQLFADKRACVHVHLFSSGLRGS